MKTRLLWRNVVTTQEFAFLQNMLDLFHWHLYVDQDEHGVATDVFILADDDPTTPTVPPNAVSNLLANLVVQLKQP